MKYQVFFNRSIRCFFTTILVLAMLVSAAGLACAANNGNIPTSVLDAQNCVVHVYLLFYKDEKLVAYSSSAGVIGMGMDLADLAQSTNWKYVFTSYSSIDPSSMNEEYDQYRTVVLADGIVYEVDQIFCHKQKNHDFAVLLLNQKIPNRQSAFLQSIDNVKNGDPVYAIGFPEPTDIYDPQYESYVEEEIILPGTVLGTDYEKNQVNYIPASMAVSKNLIGGALVDQNGYLVGMISSYRDGSGVFAITANDIFEILMDFNLPVSGSSDLFADITSTQKPSATDLDNISADIRYPRKDSYYLEKYVYGSVKKNNTTVFKDPNASNVYAGSNTFIVDKEEKVTAIAQSSGYVCVLFPDLGRAGWINRDSIELEINFTPEPGRKPSAKDLDGICANIVYPKKDSFYLDSYETRYVQSSGGKEGVYCFIDPTSKNGVMRTGNYFVVNNETEVIVIARGGGYSCVIIPSLNCAGWINSDYLVS